MPAADPCEERHSLSLRIYVAVEAIYEPRERYESAKERKASVSSFRRLLTEARAVERGRQWSSVSTLRNTAAFTEYWF
jgi:hypothetical protein